MLAFKRNFVFGQKHGEEEVFNEEGRPTFKGEWQHGFPVGEHIAWDAAGSETRTRYRDGLREELFEDGRRQRAEQATNEEELYEQIGRLKMEVEWLKKKSAELG